MSKTVGHLSTIRQSLDSMIKFIYASKDDAVKEGAGRELSLVLIKVEEARMWAGKGLSHFNTGFKQSDVAQQPETFTQEIVEEQVEDKEEKEPVKEEATKEETKQA